MVPSAPPKDNDGAPPALPKVSEGAPPAPPNDREGVPPAPPKDSDTPVPVRLEPELEVEANGFAANELVDADANGLLKPGIAPNALVDPSAEEAAPNAELPPRPDPPYAELAAPYTDVAVPYAEAALAYPSFKLFAFADRLLANGFTASTAAFAALAPADEPHAYATSPRTPLSLAPVPALELELEPAPPARVAVELANGFA